LNHAGDLPTAQHTSREGPPTSLLDGSAAASSSARTRRQLAFDIASSPAVVALALRASLVVGTLLNLINQGDALLAGRPVVVGKLLLTYVVPYCVSTYSATSISLRRVASQPRG
jgi:hypothetical protein